MPHEVTATKFRPQTFDELIGQEFVAATLKNSIKQNKIANAYLLSGPRGVGKTSAARIIAKALNCVKAPDNSPCNQCDNCKSITTGMNSDVIEIDGASNTGINDVRIIQEEILYPPVNSKYKVYIIDEVHMLSKSAFNALLKTIEEPPEYVVFIFATTEVNKVIPTIRSRCQQFNFRLIPSNLIYKSLSDVLNNYNIEYEDHSLIWISNEGKGSMRDSYTLLDQVISFCGNKITLKKIQDKLGLVGEEKIAELIKGIMTGDRKVILTEYYSLLESGIPIDQIIIDLIKFFRNILIIKSHLSKSSFTGFNPAIYEKEIIESFNFEDIENILEILFNTYSNSKFSVDLQTEMEICLLRLLKYKDFIRPGNIINELRKLKKYLGNNVPGIPVKSKTNNNQEIINKIKSNNQIKQEKVQEANITMKAEKSDILKIIKSKLSGSHFQLSTALNNISYIEEKNNQMFLFFSHKMHYDIAKKYEELLTDEAIKIIGEKYNKDFKIIVEYKIEEKKTSVSEINKKNIESIFQGKEI